MAYNPNDLSTYTIADLRHMAKAMKIDTQKDWTREQYIEAVSVRRKKNKLVQIVTDPDNTPIEPGYVRIRLPLSPTGSDSPLDVRVNNFATCLPRTLLLDVPKEVRDTLRNSTETVTREVQEKDGSNVVKTFEVPAYPFEEHGSTPGESGAVKPNADMRDYRMREMYKSIYGRWPRRQSDEWKSFSRNFLEEFSKKKAGESVNEETEAA